MSRFVTGASANPNGRPRGSTKIVTAPILRAYDQHVAPHSAEVIQRAVERALAGDTTAQAAVMALISSYMAMTPGKNIT